MKAFLPILLFSIAALELAAQNQAAPAFAPAPVTIPRVLGRGMAYNISPYTDRPADLTLIPHGSGARRGQVWVQDIGSGLLVVGKVDGEHPDFPGNRNLILEKDHVEIWLADGKDPELPAMGWGNQFGQVTLPKGADSCAEWARDGAADTPAAPTASGAEKRCRSWVETQTQYRPYFQRLFVRQWLVTPDYAVESFATPAYQKIVEGFGSDRQDSDPPDNEEIPVLLKPAETLQMWITPGRDGAGYTFEILIPFEAFPPLSETTLRDLRLMVSVVNPPAAGNKAGAYSTTSSARVWGDPATFNRLSLDPPHPFYLTPCELPLSAKGKYRDWHTAWFVPKASSDVVADAFILVNDGVGYQYEPDALSPVARPIHYFWRMISPSEWVCGPYLSYRRGGERQSFDVDAAEEGFEAHHLPGGDLLIKVGPRTYNSEFGSGQCGACLRTDLRIFRIGADQKLQLMLKLGGIFDNGTGASQDFSLTPDWSRAVQFDQGGTDEQGNPGPWSSTTWCRGELAYHQCDHADHADPPDPPVLKELRGSE